MSFLCFQMDNGDTLSYNMLMYVSDIVLNIQFRICIVYYGKWIQPFCGSMKAVGNISISAGIRGKGHFGKQRKNVKYQIIQYLSSYIEKPSYFCKCFEIQNLLLFIYACTFGYFKPIFIVGANQTTFSSDCKDHIESS